MAELVSRQIGLAAALLACLTTVAAAAAEKPASVQSLYDAAYKALSANDNANALALSARALALAPDDPNVLIVHGSACYELAKLGCAISDLEKAKAVVTAAGGDAAKLNDIDGRLAMADLAGGQPQRGLDLAEQLKRRDPSYAARMDGAMSKYFSDAAVDALKAKDNQRALDLSARALALEPNVNPLYIHGTACANLQNWACATSDLEKAKAQATAGGADAPTLNAIDAALVTTYLFGGRPQPGLDLGQQLKRREPSLSARVDDAFIAYFKQAASANVRAGDFDGAAAQLERAAQLAPRSAVSLYVQAANVLANKPQPDWNRVQAEAGKALAIDLGSGPANYVIGIAKAHAGDRAGAVPFLEKARAKAGDDPTLSADATAALKKLGAE